MTDSEKIEALEAAEMKLYEWLDEILYIGQADEPNRAKHYRMIECVKNGQKFSFSFILCDRAKYKFCVVINAVYPRPEQVLTCEQFSKWLKYKRNYNNLLQN